MRIVREYFGADRTTVTYENEISGVGGNAGEFCVVADTMQRSGAPATRTTVHFTHDEMTQLLSEYRQHYPLDEEASCPRLTKPARGWCARSAWRRLRTIIGPLRR